MKLLGIETSSERGSVALLCGADIIERAIATPREQTAKLLDLTAALLAEGGLALTDLDGIAFGRGPGSFTGLRVAAAVAQGFALTTGIALLPVSSLAALAQGAWRSAAVAHCLIAVDARMGEVYCGEFAIMAELAQPVRAEALVEPAQVTAPARPGWTALGNGFTAYAEELSGVARCADRVLTDVSPAARDLLPHAAADLAAGRAVAVEQALPTYLREQSAWRR
jgi:tRNA threonylcarbamoyladenosine biosynthesis protein TsaB